jgi:hypothetical protein
MHLKNQRLSSSKLVACEIKTIKDLKGMVKEGAKAAGNEAINAFIIQIFFGLIILFIVLLSKMCNN